ncbi:hypothetical protein HDZ31DRAFT_82613 [Schizophyllum fasciatum]
MNKLSQFQGRDHSARPELPTLVDDLERGVAIEECDLALVLQALHTELARPRAVHPSCIRPADSDSASLDAHEALALNSPPPPKVPEMPSPSRAVEVRTGTLVAGTPFSNCGPGVKAESYLATPLRTKFFPRVSPTTLRLLLQTPDSSFDSPDSSLSTDASDAAIISVLGEAPHIQGFEKATLSAVAAPGVPPKVDPTSLTSKLPKEESECQVVTTAMPLTPPPTGEIPSVARFPTPPPVPLTPQSPLSPALKDPEIALDTTQNFSPPPTPPRPSARKARRRPLSIDTVAANHLRGPALGGPARPFSEAPPILHAPHLSLLSPSTVRRFRRVIDEMRGVEEEDAGPTADEGENGVPSSASDPFASSNSSLDLKKDIDDFASAAELTTASPLYLTSPTWSSPSSFAMPKSPESVFEGRSKGDVRLDELADLLEERAAGDDAQAKALFLLAERMSAMARSRREAVARIDAYRATA